MLKKVICGFLLLTCTSSFAGLFELNQNQYLEMDFTISNSGVFDSDLNYFNMYFDYNVSSGTDLFNEKIEIFNGKKLLKSHSTTAAGGFLSGTGLLADDYSASGIDFEPLRNGSIDGKIRIHASFNVNPNKGIFVNDFFGWTLNACDAGLSCRYADSGLSFSNIRVVSAKVTEPHTALLFLLPLFVIYGRRGKLF